jgi:hypothetical protein
MSHDLKARVTEWLGKQGHPLEFATAHAFSQAGFHVTQGWHVDADANDKRRELDVIALQRRSVRDAQVGLDVVIECKWSEDKPWVIFVNRNGIGSGLQMAGAMGCPTARAIMIIESQRQELADLAMFAKRPLRGFGGIQAFSDKRDLFYQALSGVVTKARGVAREFERVGRRDLAFLVVPIVVVKAPVFEAEFDAGTNALSLSECESTRLLWQGAADWPFVAVDVVSASHVDAYARSAAADADNLLRVMCERVADLKECRLKHSLEPLRQRGVDIDRLPDVVRRFLDDPAGSAPS